MAEFPSVVRSPENRIATSSQHTADVEGWIFDGADGSQVALWTARADRDSSPHAHAFDEWVYVLEGRATVATADGERVLERGEEALVPRGTLQRMAVVAGTRTLHVFGGVRARREAPRPTLSYVVLDCADLDRSAEFYGALGLRPVRESHGTGPTHLAIDLGGVVLELYPRAAERRAPSRVGIRLANPTAAADAVARLGAAIVERSAERAVVRDPDGHTIELTRA